MKATLVAIAIALAALSSARAGADEFVYEVAAAGGTHCIEVHALKIATSPEDIAPWFEGFAKARIDSR